MIQLAKLRETERESDGRRGGGFTLIEILLTIAIIGLMATALISGATHLLSDKPVSPDEVFWKSVDAARAMALKSERQVSLQFVDDVQNKTKEFVVSNGDKTEQFAIPVAGDLEVSFLQPQAEGHLIMVAGTVLDTAKVPAVTFYPDGTCLQFRVQFYAKGASHIDSIDPWTCAPVLTPSDSTTGTAANP